MGFDEIIALAKANGAIIVFLIGAAIVLYAVAMTMTGQKSAKHPTPGSPSDDELRFRNVFGLMTTERQEALIFYYMKKHGCGRREAMRIAVDDRAGDETRW